MATIFPPAVTFTIAGDLASHHTDLKLIAGDDQKSGILDRLAAFEDVESLKYISCLGLLLHQSSILVETSPSCFPSTRSTQTSLYYRQKLARGTGSSVSLTDSDKSWSRAENYGHDILEDLNNYVAGWTDWGIALDTTGGPTSVENSVDAPILVDEERTAPSSTNSHVLHHGSFVRFHPCWLEALRVLEVEGAE